MVETTSFYGVTINTTWNLIEKAFGKSISLFDYQKQNAQWNLYTDNGVYFELYDWKEGHIGKNLPIYWHIGANNLRESLKAKEYLERRLYGSN